jgi:hypothetical protein
MKLSRSPARAVHRSKSGSLMSGLGQKRTRGITEAMSALPPKADKGQKSWHARFVPKADKCTAANASYSIGSIRVSRHPASCGCQQVSPKGR